jgi:hypothetical protein
MLAYPPIRLVRNKSWRCRLTPIHRPGSKHDDLILPPKQARTKPAQSLAIGSGLAPLTRCGVDLEQEIDAPHHLSPKFMIALSSALDMTWQ